MPQATGSDMEREDPMARVFFGLELPAPLKERLLALHAPVEGARWQGAGQLHLTLAFVGAMPRGEVASLVGSAAQLSLRGFELEVAGLGAFGNPDRPRTLWAGVRPAAPVACLHQQLMARLGSDGFVSAGGDFAPHITLARFRKQAGSVRALLDEHRDTGFGVMPVRHFALFESTPGPQGSVYTVIRRVPLN